MDLKLKEKISNYMRVLAVSRKPTKDEFTSASKICGIGILLIGIIGFVIFLAFILSGI
jgi:protein transport protein SEC61 subunit gamma-like protein